MWEGDCWKRDAGVGMRIYVNCAHKKTASVCNLCNFENCVCLVQTHPRPCVLRTEFEGQRIPNLVKTCEARQQVGSQEADSGMDHKQQDDYVLRKLFKKTGAVK